MQATHTTSQRPDLSEGMARGHNMNFDFNAQAFAFNREPQYMVYLYTVSGQKFEVSRPPNIKLLKIAPCPASQEYSLICSLPQPLLTPKGNIDSNEIDVQMNDSRRIVADIINPDNLSDQVDAQWNEVQNPTAIGNNLTKRGIFWSLSNPPLPSEVAKAKDAMVKELNRLVTQANTWAVSDPKSLADGLTPDHHYAAEVLKLDVPWHKTYAQVVDCEFCGSPLRNPNAKLHRAEDGILCVRGDWENAVRQGAVTRAVAYEATGDEQFAPRQAELD
jgi:hypothetical protein